MRKMYQTQWHGIPFESFAEVSSSTLAESDFYRSFYEEFYQRYSNVGEINPKWVELKMQTMQLIKRRMRGGKGNNILSIGCGLGVIEKALIDDGFSKLEISEVSRESLRWVEPHISKERIHIGMFPKCLKEDRHYEVIYLAGVEYFLNQRQLIEILKNAKERISPGGKCLLISWSVNSEKKREAIVIAIKNLVKYILEKIRMRHRGQFWGYSRNRCEIRSAMENAGFVISEEGRMEKISSWETYWIEGLR